MKPVVSIILRIFKIAAIVAAAFVFMVVAVVGLLNVPSIQNKFLTRATEMLEEKLQTKVEIDSIRIGFFRDDVCLYNLRVEDREHRPMLKLELLTAEIDRWALLKKEGRPLHFSTSKITGRTLLKDISHPFAPVLKDFKEPLLVSTRFSGNDNSLSFKDVVVRTMDNKLHIKAVGGLNNLKDKYKLRVHFNILDCVAKGDSKTRIINQFRVRKFMMKQVQTLGTLHYKGALDVLYKKIQLRGKVGTDCGHMQVALLVNSLDKYLSGNVQSNDLELGKAMDHPEWGRVDCKADFKIDISKVRTAAMRRQKGGKLPIGRADAIVNETKFKGIKLTGIHATIVSDGALAEGRLTRQGKLSELFCAFSFTDTNDMKKMKIKPGIHLNIFHPKKNKKKGLV